MNQDINKIIKQYQNKPLGTNSQSAVLIPLIQRDGEWHVVYQVRSEIVSQPGETSFPGGRIEIGETSQEAAVRETMEELNLSSEHIEVIGEIDYVVSPYRVIYCFVGYIHDIAFEDIQPNEEVERLFTLPLDFLMENPPVKYALDLKLDTSKDDFPYHLLRGGKKYPFSDGVARKIPFYDLEDEVLWGFTANMTERFIDILKGIE